MSAIGVNGLRKSFGEVVALDGLDLVIEPGCFFGLLGPNGAGKSTFMSILTGFNQADAGKIELFGDALDPEDLAQKNLIGLSPQNIALYLELSAEANLELFGRLYGLSGKALSTTVEEALELSQLGDRRKSKVKEFSGGMKRRLNIAVALLHKPRVLLCDEPTVGVDPQSRNAIFESLLALKAEGMTVVYSTHYMEEAERLCDEIGIIDQGKILRSGSLDDLLRELPEISRIRTRAATLSGAQLSALEDFGRISHDRSRVVIDSDQQFRLSEFFAWVENEGLHGRDFDIERPSLESLFLKLTGRELRE